MEMGREAPDTEIENTTKDELGKMYHVIILNDDEHTFDYVIEMLQAVFNMDYAPATARTVEADTTGSAIAFTTNLEEAERKRDRLHADGPDWRMPNSRGWVAALVQPADLEAAGGVGDRGFWSSQMKRKQPVLSGL